ncbi:TonB-dependent receptor [Kiloniella spongiae]|uniref:TonB-dependent receptor n=1 Tax=Kiloniella spongiae TaxID=1489064 RepID=A0A0H2MT42_9PROT|nr:TonB-dependent receptor [Kiloniella spongiae]KLN59865.1 TonB-dependent receptor [Kiloniella spongiae]
MSRFRGYPRNKSILQGIAFALVMGSSFSYAPTVAAQSTISEEYDFDIPSQDLAKSLSTFGIQSGLQISAHGDLVRGVKANAVRGRMTAQDALNEMIAGLDLKYEVTADGSVLVSSSNTEADEATLSPILITGVSNSDRHAGSADRVDSKYISSVDLARRNPTSVKEVFAGEAAVSVGGGIPSTQKVYVRGVEEHNLAVTIDGARQNNKVFHHSGNNLIDPSLLKAVRVDPTIAPADIGPGALAGGIVYETVDVDDVLEEGRSYGGFVTASYDTNSETYTNGNALFGRVGDFEALGFFKWGKGDDYDDGDGNQTVGTGTNLRSFLGKAGYEHDVHRFEISGELVDDEADRPFRANLQNLTNRNEDPERVYALKRSNLVFNYNMTEASGWIDPRVTLGYGVSSVEVPSPFGSDAATTSLSGKFENDFNFDEDNKITAGVDFYHDVNEYKDNTTPSTDEKATNVGIFGQARIEPLENLRLSFGARGDTQYFTGLDGTNFDNQGLSGNASVAYEVIEGVTLKGGYSNVFGGISLAEAYIYNPGSWDYNSNEVKPTRSQNYSIGFETEFKGFSFDASVFSSDIENARRASWGGGPHLRHDFVTRGFELGAGYDWTDGFAHISYSDTGIKVDGDPSLSDSDTTQYLGAPLGRVIAFETAHTFKDTGLSVGGTVDAALKNKDTTKGGGNPQDSYATFGLYAEYKPEDFEFLTLRLEGNNLNDASYADRASYGQEFTNVEPALEAGRSFLFSVRAEF